jgi:hypothetical protein
LGVELNNSKKTVEVGAKENGCGTSPPIDSSLWKWFPLISESSKDRDSGDETNEDEHEAEEMTQSFYQNELEKFIREKCIGVCTTPIWSSSECKLTRLQAQSQPVSPIPVDYAKGIGEKETENLRSFSA